MSFKFISTNENNFIPVQTLGELNTSYVWFDKASNMDAKFRQAALKKYAVACHIKLQLYLEEEHL